MRYRRFGKTDWQVSEIGHGMWGLADWKGADDKEVNNALHKSVELGCNFFDTAWAYNSGLSEKILGSLLKQFPGKKLYVASKVPPKNRKWPSQPEFKIKDVFPVDYIIEYTDKSLQNLGVERIDLMQFHVWEDAWAAEDEWKEAIAKLTSQGKVQHWGISVNRWEPDNSLESLRTNLFASVQVIYNIFDQNPEDHLFPLCKELDVAVIARVPFDEGTLSGTFTYDTKFPENDWRNSYFVPENLRSSVDHANALKPLVPAGMDMPEMALRFILSNPTVSTVIPGMRKINHVEANLGTADGKGLPNALLRELRAHRWDRTPTSWSQ